MEEEDSRTVPYKHEDESTSVPSMALEHGYARPSPSAIHEQGNPPPMFLVVESEPNTNYQCEQGVDCSEFISMDDGASQEDLADCPTREHSPEPDPMHVSDTGNEDCLQNDKETFHDENMVVDDDPSTGRQVTDLIHPDTPYRPLDKPNCHSVEVQVSIESSDTQEFNFTCSWERTGSFLGPRNAIVQCNVAKGWCIGVPKVNFIPPPTPPPKWSSKPAATVMHRKPVPIIVKDKNKQYGRNKVDHILFSRSIGVQCHLTPRRGYTVSSKAIQACLPISSYNNLSFLPKADNSVIPKKLPVQLPDSITITRVTPQTPSEDGDSVSAISIIEPDVSVNTVHATHKGFRGFDSIEESNHAVIDLENLSGFGTDIFQSLLKKLDISGNITPLLSNKSLLLMFLMTLNLGIPSSALGVLFGLDGTTTLDLVLTTLRTLRTRIRSVLYMPSQTTISSELPSYFRGVYKKVRIILVCAEFVVEEPKSEAERVKHYSDTKGTCTFKAVIAMTPSGKVCFKSKPYRGQTSFETIIKECNIVAYLECGDVVLAESLLPEMQIILQKGVLVVVPSTVVVKEDESSRKSLRGSEDVFGIEVRKHIERCTRRLTSVRLMREIPCSMFPYITELLQVWYSIINQMPPILRHDQPE
uniref:DDE Tnp4 domain-containing protein n=1 Tax=Lygus hesperus TaxID=30085 RepID=A0A0A9Z905_LYGHE